MLDLSMAQWFWLVYGVGLIMMLIPTARYLHQHWFDGETTGEALSFTVGTTLCLVWLWPLYIPGAWLYAVLRADERDRDIR